MVVRAIGGDGALEAIRYERGWMQLLDQRKLPHESVYQDVRNCEDAWKAIRVMMVRGAPAIAVSAVLALAVEVVKLESSFPGNAGDAVAYLKERLEYLVSSRPTAVNLADASRKLQDVARGAAREGADARSVFNSFVEAAEEMFEADVRANKAIGEYGAEAILRAMKNIPENGLRILTHCNTGSLATAAYGTALGVIRTLHSAGKLQTAYCTETRPYNQGSRLTAYELVHDNIPAVLVADSAAASLMAWGRVDAVIVGADRIAANGDTANKIGTYSLALAAHQLRIPFFVAAPITSIDTSLESGKGIVIEERPATELTHANGGYGMPIAASGIGVWNPAFDLTPAHLITAIITDHGVINSKEMSMRSLDVCGFVSRVHDLNCLPVTPVGESLESDAANVAFVSGCANPSADQESCIYYSLNESTVADYIVVHPELAERLGGSTSDWNIKEVGDGNLNYVYLIVGPRGSLVLKQALPYVRCVGDSWPMTIDRAYFEATALQEEYRLCPAYVPQVYHFNRAMALIVMRYLEPPHIILRKGLITGVVYPKLAEHVADFLAKTLFHTSLIAITSTKFKAEVARSCGNVEMCRLTEQVIFSEPYMVANNNRWTSPQLDDDVKSIRLDVQLKLEIALLKGKFCGNPQSLLHGDLHTGSIMVTETSTKVIDPEFSSHGPMGFDIGAFIGNLLLSYYSQDGHAQTRGDRDYYKDWLLQTISEFWTTFEKKFIFEWNYNLQGAGDAYISDVYNTDEIRSSAQNVFLKQVFEDSLGFAGAKMIRRIVGIAHVEDLESIPDVEQRAACERKALEFAKLLVKKRSRFSSINGVIEAIRITE